jgi:hypothetical protein
MKLAADQGGPVRQECPEAGIEQLDEARRLDRSCS